MNTILIRELLTKRLRFYATIRNLKQFPTLRTAVFMDLCGWPEMRPSRLLGPAR